MMTTTEWVNTLRNGTQVYANTSPDAQVLTVIAIGRRIPTVVVAHVDAQGYRDKPFYYTGDDLDAIAQADQIQKAARA